MKKSETPRYIAVIDPKASIESGFIIKALNAKTLIEAMTEASKLIDDETYLIDLMEKQPGGDKEKVLYQHILRNRCYGWNAAELDTNSLNNIAFYYKGHDGIKPITSCDIDWVF